MNPSPEILFTVNLTTAGNPGVPNLVNSQTTLQQSTYYPMGLDPNVIKKNNGQFTLYGTQAAYVKKMIDQGMYPNITYEMIIPTACEFSLDTDGFNSHNGFNYTDMTIESYIDLQDNLPVVYAVFYDSDLGEYNGLGVVRFNEGGKFDPNFGTNGLFFTDLGDFDSSGIITLEDNKLAIFFYEFGTSFGMAKILADGSGLDTTFNSPDGYIIHNLNIRVLHETINAPDDKFYIFGRYNGSNDAIIIRMDSDGQLDTANFGSPNGYVAFDPTPNFSTTFANGVVDYDESLIVVGNQQFTNTPQFVFKGIVAKFSSSGVLDTNFNSPDGYIAFGTTGNSFTWGVVIDRSGNIIAAGQLEGKPAIWKLTSDGTLDPSFGINGVTVFDESPYTSGAFNDIKLDSKGKILVSGSARTVSAWDGLLARYYANGSADTTFTGDNYYTTFSRDTFQTFDSFVILNNEIYTTVDNFVNIGAVKYICS